MIKYLLLILLTSCQQVIKFNIPPSLYKENIEVIIAPGEYMNEYDTSSIDYTMLDGLTTSSEGNVTIWVSSYKDNEAIINHELFHATYAIMQWINIPLSNSSEEAYAYFLGYITEEFYKQAKIK